MTKIKVPLKTVSFVSLQYVQDRHEAGIEAVNVPSVKDVELMLSSFLKWASLSGLLDEEYKVDFSSWIEKD